MRRILIICAIGLDSGRGSDPSHRIVMMIGLRVVMCPSLQPPLSRPPGSRYGVTARSLSADDSESWTRRRMSLTAVP